MAKHTQTIRRLLPTNFLSVFEYFVDLTILTILSVLAYYFVGLTLKSLTINSFGEKFPLMRKPNSPFRTVKSNNPG